MRLIGDFADANPPQLDGIIAVMHLTPYDEVEARAMHVLSNLARKGCIYTGPWRNWLAPVTKVLERGTRILVALQVAALNLLRDLGPLIREQRQRAGLYDGMDWDEKVEEEEYSSDDGSDTDSTDSSVKRRHKRSQKLRSDPHRRRDQDVAAGGGKATMSLAGVGGGEPERWYQARDALHRLLFLHWRRRQALLKTAAWEAVEAAEAMLVRILQCVPFFDYSEGIAGRSLGICTEIIRTLLPHQAPTVPKVKVFTGFTPEKENYDEKQEEGDEFMKAARGKDGSGSDSDASDVSLVSVTSITDLDLEFKSKQDDDGTNLGLASQLVDVAWTSLLAMSHPDCFGFLHRIGTLRIVADVLTGQDPMQGVPQRICRYAFDLLSANSLGKGTPPGKMVQWIVTAVKEHNLLLEDVNKEKSSARSPRAGLKKGAAASSPKQGSSLPPRSRRRSSIGALPATQPLQRAKSKLGVLLSDSGSDSDDSVPGTALVDARTMKRAPTYNALVVDTSLKPKKVLKRSQSAAPGTFTRNQGGAKKSTLPSSQSPAFGFTLSGPQLEDTKFKVRERRQQLQGWNAGAVIGNDAIPMQREATTAVVLAALKSLAAAVRAAPRAVGFVTGKGLETVLRLTKDHCYHSGVVITCLKLLRRIRVRGYSNILGRMKIIPFLTRVMPYHERNPDVVVEFAITLEVLSRWEARNARAWLKPRTLVLLAQRIQVMVSRCTVALFCSFTQR